MDSANSYAHLKYQVETSFQEFTSSSIIISTGSGQFKKVAFRTMFVSVRIVD